MKYENSLSFAQSLDNADPLKRFRSKFLLPRHQGKEVVYFCGNSLGLQPVTVQLSLQNELDRWSKYGVEGHFKGDHPWMSYHELFSKPLSGIVGALPEEVVAMNHLTVNLHLLMVSFYRPTNERFKIITETKPFPSDSYAIESQVRFHGFDPEQAIIELLPREQEHSLLTEDILAAIEKNKNSLALVLMGGVNYYTGQVFDMKSITEAAHRAGALCGFDLAHAAGNIQLNLHEWEVDFACWCSYKYLNSGPGGVAGAYIHQKHVGNKNLPRFAGWWGHDKATRFRMESGFRPIPTAEGWQLSNAPVLSMAAHKAALDIFGEAGMDALITKSKILTGYLEFIIKEINRIYHKPISAEKLLEIITPLHDRGCQLSIVARGYGKNLFNYLQEHGVVADWREPNVIRLAPVPLYNSFTDIYRFGQVLSTYLGNSSERDRK